MKTQIRLDNKIRAFGIDTSFTVLVLSLIVSITLFNESSYCTKARKGIHRADRFSIGSLWDILKQSSSSKSSTIGSRNRSKLSCGYTLRSLRAARGNFDASGRIVGGRVATIEDFPWIVSLQRERELWLGFRSYYHSCGGSVIAPSWVLTAAHCLHDRDEPLRVVAGTDNLSSLGQAQVRSVTKQVCHPNFDVSTYDNDVALIKVSEPFNLNSPFSSVSMTCVDKDTSILPYDIATICGFGAPAYHRKARSHLYETEIAIIDPRTCNSSFGYAITKNMICAGGMIQNKRDACSGDSGGPLLLQDVDDGHNVQIGIVSFGNDCAVKNYPGIYTRVSKYYKWISRNIDEPLGEP